MPQPISNVSLIFNSILYCTLMLTQFFKKVKRLIMIKGYNDEDLKKKSVDSKYFLFCQVWKELTEAKTLDSYQYKTFNTINGLEELAHNINNYILGFVNNTLTIDSTIQETILCVKTDYVLNTRYKSIKSRLLDALGKKHDTHSSIKALLYQVTFYKDTLLQKYDDTLKELLVDRVENADSENIIKLTSVFISRCVDNGWSPKALHNKIDLSDNKKIYDFLSIIINSSPQKYLILFPYRLNINPPSGKTRDESKIYVNDQLVRFGVKVYSREKVLELYSGISEKSLKVEEYMAVYCSAKDIYSAAHFSIITLSKVLNMLGFFSAINQWSLSNINLIAFNTESPYLRELNPADIYSTYEYLDSSSSVYYRTEKILNSDEVAAELKQKLFSAFNYVNLSRTSLSIEEKYMNMWIALESLTRTDAHENIIGNIIESIPNACCLRYIYRIIRNFAEDCCRCNVSLDFGEICINISESNKEVIVKDVLCVLRDNIMRNELLNRCTTRNALLAIRCSSIIQLTNDDSLLIKKVASHHQTIAWHLNRLYRIRNEIAHSALSQSISTILYTEHLYDYLATYISELVRFSYEKKLIEHEKISVAVNGNYNQFLFIANEKTIAPKNTALGEFWTKGTMNFI